MNILRTAKQVVLLIFILIASTFSEKATAQPGVSVPIESFYNELAPYGQWMQHPNYGDVWLPNAGPNFQPYATAGHWVFTDYGNTWVSDYPWGWGPFHYGRWIYDPAYGGWLWIPGPDWAPAWVDWRAGNGYYGWAPLGPSWGGQVNIPAPFWTFVPQVYITSPYIYNYYVPRPSVVNIYQRTTIINNVYRSNNWAYNYGPPRGDIERITRQPIQVYRIDRMDRPGRAVIGNGSVGFYHPGPGAVRRDGPGYNQNDRFDNSGRPNYGGNGNTSTNRGGYYGGNNAPNRDYPGNNGQSRDYNNTPNRDYPGSMNNPGRGNYGGNTPANPNGSYNMPAAPSNSQPSRPFDNSRGSYSSGNRPQGTYTPDNTFQQPQQPSRPFERMERSGSVTPQTTPNEQNGGFQRSEGRGGFSQPQTPTQGQAPGARSGNGNGSAPTGGERGGRGPR